MPGGHAPCYPMWPVYRFVHSMVETVEKKQILIVDDEKFFAQNLLDYFTHFQQYEARCAYDAEEALRCLEEHPYDLVISDIKLPGITGLELLTKIRSLYSNIGVIVMTAYALPEYQKMAKSKGALYYIEKPFDMEEMGRIVSHSLKNLAEYTERPRGFEGSVVNIHIRDIIQLNCLTKTTGCLSVSCRWYEGKIYTQDGQIIHCTCNDLIGEHAFFQMMSWESGRFSMDGSCTAERTIFRRWDQLFLDAFKGSEEGGSPFWLRGESDAVSGGEDRLMVLGKGTRKHH
jgi:CheY-like chemotaxis protein